ncbi:tRNA (adenosine(37)-N6)-threonylcarbamoyltransferase complex ATPase subunit type 1 TsaE, partial [Microbacterium sp. B24]|uniref:tRNA (adenosine(37)-N6)-threonylcarbamoyltransferase complex ATPase subunit type 1 TsaE n=1 Tax=Microbacterium sp. B24 TaxID=95616 RepID=UPI0011D1F830
MSGLDEFVGQREIASPAEMEELGRAFGRALGAGDLVVLTGPLGAGKTTLTRGSPPAGG